MNEITMIPIERLYSHPDNPRKELGDLTELADSIKANGILQNLTVIPGHRATDKELEQIVAFYDSLDDSNQMEANAKAEVREQIAKEKAVAEAWKSLEETGALALSLRRGFVEQLSVTSKNRPDVLYGALLAILFNAVEYNSPDRAAINAALGMESGYNPNRGQELVEKLDAVTNKTMAGLVYAGFDDSERDLCTESSYRKEFPRHKRSAKWELIYGWLKRLGYEPSTDEASMLDGTHSAFRACEAFENREGA